MSNRETSPQFEAANERAKRLVEVHGVDAPQAQAAMREALDLAPQWVKDELKAQQQRHERFLAAVDEMNAVIAEHGEDSPEAGIAIMQVHEHLPEELQQAMMDKMREMFQLPAATHCDADGNPLYSVAEVGAALGLDEQEAEQAFAEMLAAAADKGLDIGGMVSDAGQVHRIN